MHKEVRSRQRRLEAAVLGAAALFLAGAGGAAAAGNPDVTVIYLGSTSNWGSNGSGIRAYSVGTTSCNVGTDPVAWCDSASCVGGTLQRNDHPVIAQNMYRLKPVDGQTYSRFEQIGMSWLKHGWLSTNTSDGACGSCQSPPGGGDQLGVGCTDTYGSGLNGGEGNPGTCDGGGCRLGQRSAVNPTTGDFPMPYHNVAHPSVIDQRLQVAESDVNGTLNPGALYWVEGQYIAGDDGLAGNAFNNASYRRVTVGASPNFSLSLTGSTVREQSALYAWKAQDAAVEIVNEDFCSNVVERFEVARKVTEVVAGTTWHYEYAVRNMNSDHAGGAFSVTFPGATTITNTYFNDVDSHSGEPYSTTDWTTTVDGAAGTVRWATEAYSANNNANALRFATMYTFAFDADAAPAGAVHEVELFKPAAIADAGTDAAICVGESVQLGTPAIAGQTYLWSPGGQTTAQITVSPTATTTYTVQATGACGQVQDSVEVTVSDPPAAPVLATPANGATGLASPVALDWSDVAGATGYELEVATDAGFGDVVVSDDSATSGYVISSLADGAYFWRTRALAVCAGADSAVFQFEVDNHLFNDGFESGDTAGGWGTNP